MIPEFNVQDFVNDIFEEDATHQHCVDNILRNIENSIESCGNDRAQISRLLMMRSFLEKRLSRAQFDALQFTSTPTLA
ncbi:MAG: hypothetical protein JXR03_09545 [Cyclobacteriaceae bacterium]